MSSPSPERARPRWAGRLLGVLVLAAVLLGGFELYAGHYQPLASAGYLKPLPSTSVHHVAGSSTGTDFTGPAGAHLHLVFGLANTGPFDVHVTEVTALLGTTARWATGGQTTSQPDVGSFHALPATVPGRGGVRILLDVVLPPCPGDSRGLFAEPSSFDSVTVHWSALGRRHATRLHVIGDVPITLCRGGGG